MGVKETANSDSTKNGSEANTRSVATTPRPQIVAPETSPRCIMGIRKLRNILSATATKTNADYFDFLRRAIWKIYNTNSRSTCVGNCLSNIVTDTQPEN